MRLMRWMVRAAVVLVALLVAIVLAALVVTQTPWFKERVRRLAVSQAGRALNGELTIGRLEGTLFTGVTLIDVVLHQEGRPSISIPRVEVAYDVRTVASDGVRLDTIHVERPEIVLRRLESGWNLGQLLRPRDPDAPRGDGPRLTFPRITLSGGRFLFEEGGRRFEEIDTALGLRNRPDGLHLDMERLTFATDEPDVAVRRFDGRLTFHRGTIALAGVQVATAASDLGLDGTIGDPGPDAEYALDVDARRLSLPELARFVPALERMRVHPAFRARLDGPMEALAIQLDDLRSEAGAAAGTLRGSFAGPVRTLGGTLSIRDVDLEPILDDPNLATDVTGDVVFDLRFPAATGEGIGDGTFRFVGRRARAFGYEAENLTTFGRLLGRRIAIGSADGRAYGARIAARGTIDVPVDGKPLALDLTGRVEGADMRDLPPDLDLPTLETDLFLDYHVYGPEDAIRADAVFLEGSIVEGARLDAGSEGHALFLEGRFEYAAAGGITALDLQRLGRALDLEALSRDRFASRLGGRFDIRGALVSDEPAIVSGSAVLVDARIMGGGLPEVSVDVDLAEDRLVATAEGRFADYDLATLVDRADAPGRLTGTADVRLLFPDLTAELTPAYVDVAGVVTLEDSEAFGLPIHALRIVGEYEQGVAAIDDLTERAPGYELTGAGTLAFDEATPSSFQYRIVSDDLRPLARLFDQPVSGAAAAEGHITGTRDVLATAGTLRAGDLRYGERLSLERLDSSFELTLPDLDLDGLTATAETRAHGIHAPGLAVEVLTAETAYAGRTLDARVDATEARGRMSSEARVRWLDDGRQEAVVGALSLERNGIVWQQPAGEPARLVYDRGSSTVTVHDLTLVSGDPAAGPADVQRLAAAGRLGVAAAAASDLAVTAERIDVAPLGAFLVDDRRFDGRLDGRATIRGTWEAPVVEAALDVAQGAFGGFTFDALRGTIAYDGALADVDLVLQQTADRRFVARGLVPRTLFEPDPVPHVGHIEPLPDDRLDLEVRAERFDLSLLGEILPQLSEVAGVSNIDLRLTNAGRDPHVHGTVRIADATFGLTATGLRYHGGQAELRFDAERLVIERFQLLDPNERPLRVTGQMALHGGDIGEFAVTAQAERFALMSNEYGDVHADLDLVVDGELRQPRVQGDMTLRDARIEVDRVLARLAVGPFDVEAEAVAAALPPPGQSVTVELPPPAEPAPARAVVVEPGEPAPEEQAPDEEEEQRPGPLAATALNVRVRIPDNMILRGQSIRPGAAGLSLGDINVTVGGDFRVAKASGEPVVLVGSVNTVRGQYVFQGRRFEILRDGRITFRGTDPPDPGLDIMAERIIQGIHAQVRLHGTARAPELSLSSTPPLEEGDVLALIIFNQPMSQLGQAQTQTLAEAAGGLAAGLVVSPLAHTLGTALNIDVFEVQTTDTAGRVNPAVVLGEQIRDDLFLRFRQQFGSQQFSEFLLEYRLADYLRWRSSVAEGEGVGRGVDRSLVQRVERYGMDLVFYFAY